MTINYIAVLVAAVAQFIFGAIWYTPIFGGVWGRIHGFDQVSKEEQAAMMKKMFPLLAAQFIFTVVTTFVFALLLTAVNSDWHAFGLGGFLWLGFMLPTQISAVLFGGTKPGWILTKIAIMGGAALGCMMIAAAILTYMK